MTHALVRSTITSIGLAVLAVLTVFAMSSHSPSNAAARTTPSALVHHSHVYYNSADHHLAVYAWWSTGGSAAISTVGKAWVIWIHGGYWYKGAASQGAGACQLEVTQGRACFSLAYRLVPKAIWPAPLNDVKSGIVWVRKHLSLFGLDPARGFIMGVSAGGLMAAIAGMQDGHFAGIIDQSGVVDPYHALRSKAQLSNPRTQTNTLRLFGGVKPRQNWKLWSSARAINYATAAARRTPLLVIHGIADTTINIEMSDDFTAELRAVHYPVSYHRVPNANHYNIGTSGYAIANGWMKAQLAYR